MNLKHKRGNLKCRKRKTSGQNGQLLKPTKIFKRCLFLGRKAMTNLDSVLKSRDTSFFFVFFYKGLYSQSYSFSSHVQMWELDYKEGWVPKNWCFWIVVLEKTLESPLDSKEIKPVHPKEINPKFSLEGLMLKLQYFGLHADLNAMLWGVRTRPF